MSMFATKQEIEDATGCRTVAAQVRWFDSRKGRYFINAVRDIVVPRSTLEELRGKSFPLLRDPFDEIVKARVARQSYHIDRKATGIYLLRKGKTVVYVGQTTNFLGRAAAHVSNSNFEFDVISFTPLAEKYLDLYEQELIARLCPVYNIQHNTYSEPLKSEP